MPSRPDQPRPDDILRDENLLALIEGELSESRQREVLAALSQRPDMLATVRGMARDKALLSDLCDVEAPAEVIEGLGAVVERAALFDGAGYADLPPAPIPLRRQNGRNLSRVLAAAAAVALVAGGLGFWALSRPGPVPTPPGGPLASHTEPRPAPGDLAASAPTTALDRQGPSAKTELALAPEDTAPSAAPAPTDSVAAASLADARTPDPEETAAAPTSAPVFVRTRVTPERAVELAAQGRLALRVRADSPGAARECMNKVASRAGERSWRLCRAKADDVEAARSGVARLEAQDRAREAREQRDRAVAAAQGPAGIGDVRLKEDLAERQAHATESEPFFASVALTPDALTALRDAIESDPDVTVVFEELDGPAQPTPDVQDTEPLWWEDSPARWVPWADVLVVVER